MMPFESPWRRTREKISPEAEEAPTKTNLYELESGISVEVDWERFEPKEGAIESTPEKPAEKAVIFLPGWAVEAGDQSIQRLGQSFAEGSKNETYTVTTRTQEAAGTEDTLYEEARAISQLIKEQGLKEVTLAGHSQGGDKAINVAHILQENPEVKIDGLILIGSVGLYEQEPGTLVKGYTKDSLVDTPKTLIKNLARNPSIVKRGLRAATDILTGIVQEILRSKTVYPRRLKREIEEMARINPRLSELRMPIILVSGAKDLASRPKKIIPPHEEERIQKEWEKEEESLEEKGFIDPREEFLKENVFPKSPYIRMVVAEKLGHHGLPHFRSESVARASTYLLRRFHRRSS